MTVSLLANQTKKERQEAAAEILRGFCHPQGGAVEQRVAVVCAHPDDESIGMGGRLSRLQKALIIHTTDGAPRDLADARRNGYEDFEGYAAARKGELEAALDAGGVQPLHLLCLGIADQGASEALVALTRTLASLWSEFQPEVVFTHPYEGGHPDHDATAFAVHAATRLLEMEGCPAPVVLEMTSYHSWAGELRAAEFLRPDAAAPFHAPLTRREREIKQAMLKCFRTQGTTLRQFPVREVERFRVAPEYCFTQPPHTGKLFYEQFQWRMTGSRFRELASRAVEELGLGEPF